MVTTCLQRKITYHPIGSIKCTYSLPCIILSFIFLFSLLTFFSGFFSGSGGVGVGVDGGSGVGGVIFLVLVFLGVFPVLSSVLLLLMVVVLLTGISEGIGVPLLAGKMPGKLE